MITKNILLVSLNVIFAYVVTDRLLNQPNAFSKNKKPNFLIVVREGGHFDGSPKKSLVMLPRDLVSLQEHTATWIFRKRVGLIEQPIGNDVRKYHI